MSAAAPAGVDPQAWAALLRWSMQQQKEGDGTQDTPVQPMSEENKAWLTKVMQEGVVDLVQRAGEIIEQLRTDALNPAGEAAKSAAEAALPFQLPKAKLEELLERVDELQEIVEQIDFAMSLVQIGGLPPLLAIVVTPSLPYELRAEVLSVLATVAQNNPYAQDALLACKALPMAVALLLEGADGAPGGRMAKEESCLVTEGEGSATSAGSPPSSRSSSSSSSLAFALRVKALHFLSCLSRGHPAAEQAFYDGARVPPSQNRRGAPCLPPASSFFEAPAAEGASKGAASQAAEQQQEQAGSEKDESERGGEWVTGPVLLRRVLLGAAPDVKLKKRAAFLCNALVASEHCPSGSGKGGSSSSAAGRREYFKQCGGALVSLATGLDANDATAAAAALTAAQAAVAGGGGGGGGDLALPPAPVGGLEVDLRETAIRALTTFASQGFGVPLLLAPRGTALRAAKIAADARAAAEAAGASAATQGKDDAADECGTNAAAEAELWAGLWDALPRT